VPVEFLTDAQAATYGCYAGPPSTAELDRCFLLDDKARALIESKRLPHTRLGFAVQLTTLLFIGRFLADPTDVPTEVVDYLAEQLDIADPSCVKDYRVREMTRLEHATQIRDAYGFVEFTAAAEELTRWVDDRAWTTGDGPTALFDGAVVCPGPGLDRVMAPQRDAPHRDKGGSSWSRGRPCRAERVASGARDLAGLQARRAHVLALAVSAGVQGAHGLDVRVPAAVGTAVRVRDGHAEARTLAADVTDGSHVGHSSVRR
jgi:hypothetical protein